MLDGEKFLGKLCLSALFVSVSLSPEEGDETRSKAVSNFPFSCSALSTNILALRQILLYTFLARVLMYFSNTGNKIVSFLFMKVATQLLNSPPSCLNFPQTQQQPTSAKITPNDLIWDSLYRSLYYWSFWYQYNTLNDSYSQHPAWLIK